MLIAVARAEDRCIVRPWSETEDGRLVDHSSRAFIRAAVARCEAEAMANTIDERDIDPLTRPPFTNPRL